MKGYATQMINDPQLPKVLRPAFSIRYDSAGKIIRGLLIGATQAQNEALILAANPGEFKNSPRMGVGMENALLGDVDDMLSYRHETRRCYRLEGLEIEELNMFNIKNINIKAKYK